MKKDEFIKTVLEQIRCEAVREPLKQELETHIADQTEAFISDGMPEEQAEEYAVKTMGDPVETGVRLDSVHRPHFPKTTALAALALLLCTAFSELLVFNIEGVSVHNTNIIIAVFAGIIFAAVFYFLDYTFFLKAPKITYGAAVFLILSVILLKYTYCNVNTNEIARYTCFFGGMLLIPLMCGATFSMRGGGFGKFILACVFAVVPPVIIGIITPNISMAVMSGYAALAALTVIVSNGGFRVNKKSAYAFMYISAAAGTVGAVLFMFRRHYFVPAAYTEINWGMFSEYIKKALGGAKLFGRGSYYPEYLLFGAYTEKCYLVSACYLGLFAAALLIALSLLLPVIIIIKSRGIKNLFGRTLSAAIGITFLFMTICSVCTNFEIPLFFSFAGFPFSAASVSNCAASGALTGIFLSICRRRDMMPERKLYRTPKAE